MTRRCVAALVLLASVLHAHVVMADPEAPFQVEEKPWVEGKTAIPDYPKDSNLIEFAVGPTEHNRFYIDGSTISIGEDGVVRYVVVIAAAGGARNVSLEAMRCATREVKLFAVGQNDGTWNKLPAPQWQRIESKSINQYRTVLNRDFFCPSGYAPRDANDARAALRRGKHPEA